MYSTRETGFYWVKVKPGRFMQLAWDKSNTSHWEVMQWYAGSNCFVSCDSHTPFDRDRIERVGERLNPPED